jgi:hypothetical protein
MHETPLSQAGPAPRPLVPTAARGDRVRWGRSGREHDVDRYPAGAPPTRTVQNWSQRRELNGGLRCAEVTLSPFARTTITKRPAGSEVVLREAADACRDLRAPHRVPSGRPSPAPG